MSTGIDPYVYAGTDVLKNSFGIRDPKTFEETEAAYSSLRLSDLAENPMAGEFDVTHLCAMHRYIFQDLFEWAGQFRTIDIEKPEAVLGGLSVEYTKHRDISCVLTEAVETMKSISWKRLESEKRADLFSDCFARIWKVHPFREGNTRTITHFCCQYADSVDMAINRDLLKDNSQYLRSALVAANAVFEDLGDRSKTEYLYKIIRDAMGLL